VGWAFGLIGIQIPEYPGCEIVSITARGKEVMLTIPRGEVFKSEVTWKNLTIDGLVGVWCFFGRYFAAEDTFDITLIRWQDRSWLWGTGASRAAPPKETTVTDSFSQRAIGPVGSWDALVVITRLVDVNVNYELGGTLDRASLNIIAQNQFVNRVFTGVLTVTEPVAPPVPAEILKLSLVR